MGESRYSAFRHFASAVGLNKEGTFFVMFNLYCDAANGGNPTFVVVGGWLSSFVRWERFEVDWRLLLARYDVPYFHMKEFSQSRGPFASWEGNEPKRSHFLGQAVSIIQSHVEFGVSCFVSLDVFESVNQNFMLEETFGCPYALAGRHCVARANEYLRRTRAGRLPEIAYVFDDGDEGKGDLLNAVSRECGRYPTFWPSRDIVHKKTGDVIKGMVQLQAADFAAYELRKAKIDDPNEEWAVWKYRKSLQGLSKIPADWQQYQEADVLQMCGLGPDLIPPRG